MQLVCQGIADHAHARCFYFYEYRNLKWILKCQKQVSKQDELYELLTVSHEPIDYAIIDLNRVYRNTFYAYSQATIIIIPPTAVWQFFSKLWLVGQELYVELATTIEEELEVMQGYEYNYAFLKNLYEMSSKEMAEAYYEQWQLEVSLTDHSMQRFIRTMEVFKAEIFNYFIFKQILDNPIPILK